MKIVITGALGHIGSQLARNLAYEFPQAEFVLIDNLRTQRFSSLFNLPGIGNYRFIEADVTTVDLLTHLKEVHAVVHLAAITDAEGSFEKAAEVESHNFEGTKNVALACAANRIRLISISSTSVYGSQANVVTEDCSEDDLKPQSPYAMTKLREEQFVAELCINKGLKAVCCRFGTIFGASAGMRFHTAVNKFCWQAVMGQHLTVWNTAYDQKRPYLDLLDATRAIAFIIRKDLFRNQIYNVLTLNSTVRRITDTIRELCPDLQMSFVDSRIMNQLSYEVSCEKFKSEGFVFIGDLRRGIGETINLLRHSNKN